MSMVEEQNNTSGLGQVVRWAKRPLLTIPSAPASVRLAAVRCYSGQTWKRRMVRGALGLAVRSGVAAWLWDQRFPPLGSLDGNTFRAWAAGVASQLGRSDLYPVIVWPPDPRRGRIYVHLLDAEARRAAFAKVALDQRNSDLLRNEERTLRALRTMHIAKSRIPEVFDSGTLAGHAYVVVESVPASAESVDFESDASLAENIREYAGPTRTLSSGALESLAWWQQFERWPAASQGFQEVVRQSACGGVEVCRVHGDLNRTNVLRADGETWLLDWERSSEQGPCLTDAICIDADRRWERTQRDPLASWRDFQAVHWDNRSKAYRHQVVLALAYLATVDFTPATTLIAG
jgi:hypothetical protein